MVSSKTPPSTIDNESSCESNYEFNKSKTDRTVKKMKLSSLKMLSNQVKNRKKVIQKLTIKTSILKKLILRTTVVTIRKTHH